MTKTLFDKAQPDLFRFLDEVSRSYKEHWRANTRLDGVEMEQEHYRNSFSSNFCMEP